MTAYKNLEGHSGVTGYETGKDRIVVEFNNQSAYLYTYKSAGKEVIEKMKRLANAGRGLSTYISQSVREQFEQKIN